MKDRTRYILVIVGIILSIIVGFAMHFGLSKDTKPPTEPTVTQSNEELFVWAIRTSKIAYYFADGTDADIVELGVTTCDAMRTFGSLQEFIDVVGDQIPYDVAWNVAIDARIALCPEVPYV
jgi:hypothetical protein